MEHGGIEIELEMLGRMKRYVGKEVRFHRITHNER
jgi:hypothetical protein